MATLLNNESYNYTQISASTAIKTGDGLFGGIFVSAASSTPTITIYDNTAASGTKVVDTFTPTAGQFYRIPACFGTGCYVAISGTVSCTVFWV